VLIAAGSCCILSFISLLGVFMFIATAFGLIGGFLPVILILTVVWYFVRRGYPSSILYTCEHSNLSWMVSQM